MMNENFQNKVLAVAGGLELMLAAGFVIAEEAGTCVYVYQLCACVCMYVCVGVCIYVCLHIYV